MPLPAGWPERCDQRDAKRVDEADEERAGVAVPGRELDGPPSDFEAGGTVEKAES